MIRLGIVTGLIFFALTAAAAPSTVVSFRTPSGNIGCVYAAGLAAAPSLRCDIRSRLRPRPPKPPACALDWGDSFAMSRTGRVRVTCHGDTAIIPSSRALRYGSSWARGGFVCASRVNGLRCRNASDHGFFLSRRRSYRF